MDIRAETPADLEAIRAVHLAAFPTSAESDLVDRIRDSVGFVPELSLVADIGASESPRTGARSSVPTLASSESPIVGHILLSHVGLGGSPEPILALAPMAVLPEHQRRGVGSALVRAALDTAEAHEEALVVVLGHPWFYPRFGFRPASRYGIFPTDPWPDAAFMAKPLTRWSRDLRGRVIYPPTFDGV